MSQNEIFMKIYNVFPRIVVHALIYETALFFRAKNVIKLTIFLELVTIMYGPRISRLFRGDLSYFDLKNMAVSFISACTTMRGNTVQKPQKS